MTIDWKVQQWPSPRNFIGATTVGREEARSISITRMRGISYSKTMDDLEHLLDNTQLIGHRRTHERQWQAWKRACIRFHAIQCTHPDAKPARAWLTQQGVSESTIKKFQIGYVPWVWPHLDEDECAASFDVCEMDRLVWPITDSEGRYWGCLSRPLQDNSDPSVNCTERATDESPHRFRRMVFGPPSNTQAVLSDTVLVTQDAWDVVTLYNAGIPNVACWLPNAASSPQYAIRTILGRVSSFIYPCRVNTRSLETLFEVMGSGVSRVRLLNLLHHKDIGELLKAEGPAGVRCAMANAVPACEWLAIDERDDKP